MARPREFDLEELLETVMQAFWKNGLQATSMREIEALTGVKQVSIYNAFGSKKALFAASLQRYTRQFEVVLDSYLEDRDLDGITAFVEAIVTPDSGFPNNSFGCLSVNTALVAEAGDSVINSRVDECREMVLGKLTGALLRAKTRDTLKPGLKLDLCAEMLVSTIWGVWVTIRLAADQTAGRPAVDGLNRIIQDWKI